MKRIILMTGFAAMITAGASAQMQTGNTNSNTNPQQNYNTSTPVPRNTQSAQPPKNLRNSSDTNNGTSYPGSHSRNTKRNNANSIKSNTNATSPTNNSLNNHNNNIYRNPDTPVQVH